MCMVIYMNNTDTHYARRKGTYYIIVGSDGRPTTITGRFGSVRDAVAYGTSYGLHVVGEW